VIERVGEGVEVLRLRPRARVQRLTNIYLLADDGGVTVFESGSVGMGPAIEKAAAERGGIQAVVLSHAHADHRGGASQLDAPILCHHDERGAAEGDGWMQEGFALSKVRNPLVRALTPGTLRRLDGGPVKVADTLSEGDSVAGLQVLHLPGHTPGLIGLWRESDRLAIVSDAVFVFEPFSMLALPGRVRLPPPVVRPDDAAARESMRRIAALEPASVWLGHYGPVTGDVRAKLETAAEGD
jgi:glyoxylase-like metal-dependent hydrolase (beta-lactamase superfamily II)